MMNTRTLALIVCSPALLSFANPAHAAPPKLGSFDRIALLGQAAARVGQSGDNAGGGLAIELRNGPVTMMASIQPGGAVELTGRASSVVWKSLLSPQISQSAGYFDLRVSPWHTSDSWAKWLGLRLRGRLRCHQMGHTRSHRRGGDRRRASEIG